MQEENELYQSRKFLIWRNDILQFYENALSDSLDSQGSRILEWTYPNHILFILQNCIMSAYSPMDITRQLLEYDEDGPPDSAFEEVTNAFREVLDSLVDRRIHVWSRTIHWICVAVYYGSYDSVARELRLILEDSLQALVVDHRHPDETIEERIDVLHFAEKEGEFLRGSTLIDSTTLPKRLRRKIKKLYKELCGYVHPSSELIRKTIDNRSFLLEYNEEWFEMALNWHRSVFDFVVLMILTRFPRAIQKLLTDFDCLDGLKDNGFKETLKFCETHLDTKK